MTYQLHSLSDIVQRLFFQYWIKTGENISWNYLLSSVVSFSFFLLTPTQSRLTFWKEKSYLLHGVGQLACDTHQVVVAPKDIFLSLYSVPYNPWNCNFGLYKRGGAFFFYSFFSEAGKGNFTLSVVIVLFNALEGTQEVDITRYQMLLVCWSFSQ